MPYIGQQPTSVAFLTDTFSGNGSTTAFTLSAAPANTSSVLVAVSGVLQDPSTYSVSGTTLTFSGAPPSGTSNISVRFLGIPASGVTTTAYRTVTEFTATAAQTTFSVPSYTVGFIDVYRNGVMLGSADYTATNGTTVVLALGATAGDLIEVISFQVSSVLNAIPATAGSVGSSNIANGVTINFADGSASAPSITNDGDTNTGLFFPAADSIGFAEGGAEVARFDSSGNLGIGTVSPGYKLQVNRTGNGTAARFTNGSTIIDLWNDSSSSYVGDANALNALEVNTASNRLTLNTNNNQRLLIDSAGRVTTPFQPAFSARRDAGHVGGSSGNSVIVVFDNVLLNTGSNYNNSNGRFTAPVAGTYYFSSLGMQTGSGSVADAQLRLNKNGSSVAISNPPMGSSTNLGMGFAVSAIIQLNVGDYVQVEWYNSSTWTLYANGGPWNNFSGFLLG